MLVSALEVEGGCSFIQRTLDSSQCVFVLGVFASVLLNDR